MDTPVNHQIILETVAHDQVRDYKRIRLACVEYGCVTGFVEGRPARRIDSLAALVVAEHPGMHT